MKYQLDLERLRYANEILANLFDLVQKTFIYLDRRRCSYCGCEVEEEGSDRKKDSRSTLVKFNDP